MKDESQTYTDAILKPKPQTDYKGGATLIPKVDPQNETIANNYESIKYDMNTLVREIFTGQQEINLQTSEGLLLGKQNTRKESMESDLISIYQNSPREITIKIQHRKNMKIRIFRCVNISET